MRVEAMGTKMASSSAVGAMAPNELSDDGRLVMSMDVVHGPAQRLTGKRTKREEPTESKSRTLPHGTRVSSPVVDMTTASPLYHQLLMRKRMMLDAVTVSPATEGVAPVGAQGSEMRKGSGSVWGDDEAGDHSDETSAIATTFARTQVSKIKDEPMSKEDVQKRKAQRRREQVRAASRRCRDRQRRETEELRMKVFQLEEFIGHTFQSYENELRLQREQNDTLQRENDRLRALMENSKHSPATSASPGCVQSAAPQFEQQAHEPVKLAYETARQGQLAWEKEASQIVWNARRLRNLRQTVSEVTRVLVSIANSDMPRVLQRSAFGWTFDFWNNDRQYFATTRKFFPGVKAYDLVMRNFNVDCVKYIKTFPEVLERTTLQQLAPNVKIIQSVKALPGKGMGASVTCNFVSRDEQYQGERWIIGYITVGSQKYPKFSREDECNGYVFEDVTVTTKEGRQIQGCVARGTGQYDPKDQDVVVLMEEFAKILASVVIRWESMFINDYVVGGEEEQFGDIDGLEFESS